MFSMLHGELDFDVLTADASFIADHFQLSMMMLVIAWLGNKTINTRKNVLVRLSYAGGGGNTILIQL